MYEDFLQKIPLFAELSYEDLTQLCTMVTEVPLAEGEELFAEGSLGQQVYVLEKGSLEIIKDGGGGREVLLAVHEKPGTVIGEMSLIEQAPRMASVRARHDSFLLAIHHDRLDELLNASPTAARSILQTVIQRWRNTEGMLRQSEKMAQLGTLTAGVAHELNNPAAAVKRGAQLLLQRVGDYGRQFAALKRLNIDPAKDSLIEQLVERAQEAAIRPAQMDSLQRSDLEYEIEEWLDELGLEDGWELAPDLVNLGYEVDELVELCQSFTEEELTVVLPWLSAVYTTNSLLAEISQGAGRISEIVKALKTYSYLDQAPVQSVDIHEGLDNTLVILRNKLKTSVNVQREYAPDLPEINGYGSELNQVWTNIIDNAIDAMNGEGMITIKTEREGKHIFVSITDTGPGIPKEIISKIFDPFFTTKAPGKGTGLGLSISYNIIVQKHRGDIQLDSEPGRTTFKIRLPINFEES